MTRKEELLNIFADMEGIKDIIAPMIDDVVFLEEQLTELKKYPMLKVNPNNPTQQKATPASKLYKEYLQQYNNCIKILCSTLTKNNVEEESPLREFIKIYGER